MLCCAALEYSGAGPCYLGALGMWLQRGTANPLAGALTISLFRYIPEKGGRPENCPFVRASNAIACHCDSRHM